MSEKRPHPVDVHVGKRLRLRRSMLGMSQETLGKSIGVTFQQIQKYERGINRIGSSRLYDFSKTLTVPIAYFFEDFGETANYGFAETEKAEFEHEKIGSKESLSLVRAFGKITDPDLRKKVLSLVRAMSTGESA